MTNKSISDDEYDNFLKVWNTLQMKMMKDYHYLYLKCDVLLLAVFKKKNRNNSLKNYGLCQNHYLSAPGLSWDAMLNMTKVELELIPDPDIYLFFEEGMRGGVSYIHKGYSTANNKSLKSYDPNKNQNITYLGANNLYGYKMSKFHPTSRFE